MYNFPYYQPQQAPQNDIQWVQGEAGARAYLIGRNQSVILMDSEAPVFYIKSTDASGMPLPLRTFDFKERGAREEKETPKEQPKYVTHEELEERLAKLTPKKGAKDESTV